MSDGARNSQGDIVLLTVPYADGRGEKLRPALIISCDALNRSSTDCVILALTTVQRDSPYLVPLLLTDLASGVLRERSYIRADAIHTVEQRLLGRRVGRLRADVLEFVLDRVLCVLGRKA